MSSYTALCTFLMGGSTPQENHKIITGDTFEMSGGECVWSGVKIPFSNLRKAINAGWVVESSTEEAKQAVRIAQTDPERAQEFPHLCARKNSLAASVEDVGVEAYRSEKVRVKSAEGEGSIEDALQSTPKPKPQKVKPIVLSGAKAAKKSVGEEPRAGRASTPTHPKTVVLT